MYYFFQPGHGSHYWSYETYIWLPEFEPGRDPESRKDLREFRRVMATVFRDEENVPIYGPQFDFEDPNELVKLRNRQPISLGEIRKFVQFFGFPALPMEPGFEEHVAHYWLVDYPAFPCEAEQRKKYDIRRKTLITPDELWANIQAEWADCQSEEKALRSRRNRAGRIWRAFVKALEEIIKERNMAVENIIICPGPDGVVRDRDAEGSFIRFNAPDDSGPIENHRGFYIDLACEEEDPLPFIDAKDHHTWYEYDALNQLTRKILDNDGNGQKEAGSPDSYEEYTYYASGQIKTKRNYNGSLIKYEYDPVHDWQTKAEYPTDGLTVEYAYEPITGRTTTVTETRSNGTRVTSFAYDQVTGRPSLVAKPEGTLAYTYDVEGRLASVRGMRGTGDVENHYYYDPVGRLESVETPEGVARYTYF